VVAVVAPSQSGDITYQICGGAGDVLPCQVYKGWRAKFKPWVGILPVIMSLIDDFCGSPCMPCLRQERGWIDTLFSGRDRQVVKPLCGRSHFAVSFSMCWAGIGQVLVAGSLGQAPLSSTQSHTCLTHPSLKWSDPCCSLHDAR
jgi:hypothetical protein